VAEWPGWDQAARVAHTSRGRRAVPCAWQHPDRRVQRCAAVCTHAPLVSVRKGGGNASREPVPNSRETASSRLTSPLTGLAKQALIHYTVCRAAAGIIV